MKAFIALTLLSLLAACGHGRSDGGQASFDSALYPTLDPSEHATYAQTVVLREERDPDDITLEQLRKSKYGQIRKIGLVLFETQYQPSRSGLAVGRNVYLSEKGKQVLAEQTLKFWDKKLRETGKAMGVEWVKRDSLLQSKAFRSYGSTVEDMILTKNYKLGEDDAFWKSGGQNIPMGSLILPRNYQDISILFIPATEMMLGAKMVEHQKHWINDLCSELGLDAVLIVSSEASWSQGGKDKRTQEVIPEEMNVEVSASILYPLRAYGKAAEELKGVKMPIKKSVPLATYHVETTLPVVITIPEAEQNFTAIEKNILRPFFETYEALSGLVIDRINTDIRQTIKETP